MNFIPFEKLTHALIYAFRKKGKRWLVSQTLQLNISDPALLSKTLILTTHYDDKGMAFVHHKAVVDDKYASVIDLEREIHRKVIIVGFSSAPGQNCQFVVFVFYNFPGILCKNIRSHDMSVLLGTANVS